jgi:uncharacterized protein (DUF433 family)
MYDHGMSLDEPTRWKYLAHKAGSHYRQLFIKGTRIAARVLYGYYTAGEDWPGQSVEEIAAGFNLPIEAVREAIAYCASDPPAIREDSKKEDALMEAAGMNDPNYRYRPFPKALSAEDYARIFLNHPAQIGS